MKTTTNLAVLLLCFFVSSVLNAQDGKNIKLSGFLDTYYSYDFNKPANHEKPSFFYNYSRHNEINVNLGLLKAAYESDRIRANLGLMVGTYGQYNLSSEQGLMKNIYEANAGVKLSDKAWLDAGIMSSHIGWESAISKDNPTLTRSLAAENSPYYLSAVKLSYDLNKEWYVCFLVANGWQRIQRVDENSTPSFGAQITYKPSDKLTINYSAFTGNDHPDSLCVRRFFNDTYVIYRVSDVFGITAGFDYGMEQKHKGASTYHTWLTWALIGKFQWSEKFSTSGRIEQYLDKNGVIISTGTPHGFQTWGLSVNLDYRVASQAWIRTEIRDLISRDKIFVKGNSTIKTNLAWTSSLAVAFD